MPRRDVFRAVAVLVPGEARLVAGDSGYEAAIAEWRKNYDCDLVSDKGPLHLIGRHDLSEGRSVIGSDGRNPLGGPTLLRTGVGSNPRDIGHHGKALQTV